MNLYSYILAVLMVHSCLFAQVVVNSAQPITRRVIVNPIRVVTEDGRKADVWGEDRAVEFYIKDQVDRILNQSGVDVQFSPVIEFVSDFVFDGSPIDYTSTTRPRSDLNQIVGLSDAPVFTDVEVINCFFVEIVPGFSKLSENSANGLAFVPGNGIAIQFGENLFDFIGGRDVLASVLAHEIGHNLGLGHTNNNTANLMSPGGTSEQLTAAQTMEVLNDTSFPKALADTDYGSWSNAFSLAGGETSDDDGDGYSNLLEFALGMDPQVEDLMRAPQGDIAANGVISLQVDKQKSAMEDGIDYEIEVSADLGGWVGAGSSGSNSTLEVDNDNELIGRLDVSSDRKKFIRLAANRSTMARSVTLDSSSPKEMKIPKGGLSTCGEGGCGHKEVFAE